MSKEPGITPKFVIKHESGTYFREMTHIGPRFGVTLEEAQRFSDKHEAELYGIGDWRFMGTHVEEV